MSYLALVLDKSSRRLLREMSEIFVPGVEDYKFVGDHLTITLDPDEEDLKLVGEIARVKTKALGFNDKVVAVSVGDGGLSDNSRPHITLGVAGGARPQESNKLRFDKDFPTLVLKGEIKELGMGRSSVAQFFDINGIGKTKSTTHKRNFAMKNIERTARKMVALDNLGDVLDQLIDMAAESFDLGRYNRKNPIRVNFYADSKVVSEARKFEKAVERTLDEWVDKNPHALDEGYEASDLYAEDGPYNVLMGLNGHGVGIWDGRWDHFFVDTKSIKSLERHLDKKLDKFAESTGTGSLNEAMMDAAFEQDTEARGHHVDEDMEEDYMSEPKTKKASKKNILDKKYPRMSLWEAQQSPERREIEKLLVDVGVGSQDQAMYAAQILTRGKTLRQVIEDDEWEADEIIEKIEKSRYASAKMAKVSRKRQAKSMHREKLDGDDLIDELVGKIRGYDRSGGTIFWTEDGDEWQIDGLEVVERILENIPFVKDAKEVPGMSMNVTFDLGKFWDYMAGSGFRSSDYTEEDALDDLEDSPIGWIKSAMREYGVRVDPYDFTREVINGGGDDYMSEPKTGR